MTGLIEDIEFSYHTRFSVRVFSDYEVKGSFSPGAVSDYDYYGYRETDFIVTQAFGYDATGEAFEFNQDELNEFMNRHEDRITLIVQDKLDEMKDDRDV